MSTFGENQSSDELLMMLNQDVQESISLSEKEFESFLKACNKPKDLNTALKEALSFTEAKGIK